MAARPTDEGSVLRTLVGMSMREEFVRANEPVLNEMDRQSPTWLKIKAHAEKRLAVLRQMNDGDKDAVKTAKLRGRIAEAKLFAGLDKPAPQAAGDDSE